MVSKSLVISQHAIKNVKKNIVARKKKKAQQKQKLAARQENVKTTVSLQLFKGKINGIVSVLITA